MPCAGPQLAQEARVLRRWKIPNLAPVERRLSAIDLLRHSVCVRQCARRLRQNSDALVITNSLDAYPGSLRQHTDGNWLGRLHVLVSYQFSRSAPARCSQSWGPTLVNLSRRHRRSRHAQTPVRLAQAKVAQVVLTNAVARGTKDAECLKAAVFGWLQMRAFADS